MSIYGVKGKKAFKIKWVILISQKQSKNKPSNIFGKSLIVLTLPNNKIFDWCTLNAFAANEIIMGENLKLVLARIENVVEKEKMLVTNNVFKRLLIQDN